MDSVDSIFPADKLFPLSDCLTSPSQTCDHSGSCFPSCYKLLSNKYVGVSKNNGTPKMDGENNGKPY